MVVAVADMSATGCLTSCQRPESCRAQIITLAAFTRILLKNEYLLQIAYRLKT